MLDVHPPHAPTHSWKDFFIHIATICIGLLIAIGLEQAVEAMHRHHEAAILREDLHAECDQVLTDASQTERAMVANRHALNDRILQAQATVWGHQPLAPFTPIVKHPYASPDIPIWRAAKSSSITGLLTKGEINAYSEVEYVQMHVEADGATCLLAMGDLLRFGARFPPLPDGKPDFAKGSAQDMQTYLTLLTAASQATQEYITWLRVIIGAELAVRDGKTKMKEIYYSESNSVKHPTNE